MTDDLEMDDILDAMMLDYPTITRDETGAWDYFDVTPARAEIVWEDGKPHRLDGLADVAVQAHQGEDLALETLAGAAGPASDNPSGRLRPR
jgi:hypothetical protein